MEADVVPEEVNVVVPDGCYPGDLITVTHRNRDVVVTIPEGVGPGDMMYVDVPIEEQG